MILERTGDSRWYVRRTELCGSADEWGPVVKERLNERGEYRGRAERAGAFIGLVGVAMRSNGGGF